MHGTEPGNLGPLDRLCIFIGSRMSALETFALSGPLGTAIGPLAAEATWRMMSWLLLSRRGEP